MKIKSFEDIEEIIQVYDAISDNVENDEMTKQIAKEISSILVFFIKSHSTATYLKDFLKQCQRIVTNEGCQKEVDKLMQKIDD